MASSPPSTAPATKQVQPSESSALPWVSNGIGAGLLGAAVVAIAFLFIDLAAGRPLFTPHALGEALFLGQQPDPAETPDLLMVLAYSIVHGVVFVAFGVPAAFQMLARARAMRSPAAAFGLAAVLFVGFEVVFVALGRLFLVDVISVLGVVRITIANALAAAAMAAFLWLRARRG